jgi:hypothetical protein
MPVYARVPLPGPFVWSSRLTGRRRRASGRFGSALYWLLGIWALELAFWLVVGTVALIVWGARFLIARYGSH